MAVSKTKQEKKTAADSVKPPDQFALGKQLRNKAPRKSHAGWKAPAHRRDPIDLLIDSSKGRMKELLPIRYGRMMLTPFTFYRGAASIMAYDLSTTPSTGVRVQACGDCHLMNFGAFATQERRVLFDINDFDETHPAPWEWDVKRLAASFVIAALNNKLKPAVARDCALRCVKAYREHMAEYSEMRVLDRWYERIDIEEVIKSLSRKEDIERIQKRIQKAKGRDVMDEDFPKLVSVDGGKPRINDNPPLIFHLKQHEDEEVITSVFQKYVKTVRDDLRILLNQYRLVDVAGKVVGVGSVGTRCAIVLMMAGENDPLFLQAKEARTSVLEPYTGRSIYQNHGQRVVVGQRLMQAASDMFLGWSIGAAGHHYYFRQLRDMKIKPLVEIFDDVLMRQYAGYCGWALARAHAKSGNPAILSGYLGGKDVFDEAVADFAVAYAAQNEKDHAALLKAIRSGKLEARREAS